MARIALRAISRKWWAIMIRANPALKLDALRLPLQARGAAPICIYNFGLSRPFSCEP